MEVLEISQANQLKAFRQRCKISQVDLAKETGYKQTDISKYENGIHAIPMDIVKHLHKKYKMSYKWFFHREGTMKDVEPPKNKTMDILQTLIDDNRLLTERVNKLERDFKFLASKI